MNNYFPVNKSLCDSNKPAHYLKEFKNKNCQLFNDVNFDLDKKLDKRMDEYYNKIKIDYSKEVSGIEQFKLPASNNNIMLTKDCKSINLDSLNDKTFAEIDIILQDTNSEKINPVVMNNILGTGYDDIYYVSELYKPVYSNLPPSPFNIYNHNTKFKPYDPINSSLYKK